MFKDLALHLGCVRSVEGQIASHYVIARHAHLFRGLSTPNDFILAYVGVQEYQDRLNKDMAEKR